MEAQAWRGVAIIKCKKIRKTYWKKKVILKDQLKRLPALGDSVAVQWLVLYNSTAEGVDSILCWGMKILQATLCGKKKFLIAKS